MRKEYENYTVKAKRSEMTQYEIKDDLVTNTLTTVQHDNLLLIGVKQATRKGYIECRAGGVCDLSYPTSELRRGRVQGGGDISPTLTAQSMGICRIERNEEMETLRTEIDEMRTDHQEFIKWGLGTILVITLQEIADGNERAANTLEYLKSIKYTREPLEYLSKGLQTVFTPTLVNEVYETWKRSYLLDGLLNDLSEKIITDVESRRVLIECIKAKSTGLLDLWRAADKALEMWDEHTEIRYRIRKLTSKECWRLMGFTDEDYFKAKAVNSNSQLYKQAGNSIVTTCLMAIFSQLHIEGCPVWNELDEDARNKLIDRTRKNFTPEVQSDERDFDEDDEETADSLDEESEEW